MTIYKQTFFVIVFTFLLLITFSSKLQAQEYKWGNWTQDPCYRGLQFRARYTDYNDSAKKHHWYIQYKNNYTQKFAFILSCQHRFFEKRIKVFFTRKTQPTN